MKKITAILSALVLMISVVALFAFNTSAAGTSFEDALQMSFGTTYSDSITETERQDYFKVVLPSSGKLTIDITSYMHYYCLYLYNDAGEQIWYTDYNEYISTTGMRSDTYNFNLVVGTYYIRANGYERSDRNASTGNYNLKASFISANETKAEPNNIIAQASPLSFNSPTNGQIAMNDRNDYYSIVMPSNGKITIDFTSYMQYYCIRIYNTAGEEVWYTDYNEWVSTTGTRSDSYGINLLAGTYYIRVNGYEYRERNASTGNYNIKVGFTSANESKAEPNNTIAEASPLSFNTLTNGQIAINDRNDYYKIVTPSNGRITIDATSYMRYYTLILYNTAGETVWYDEYNEYISTTGTRSDRFNIDLLEGTYYLRITGYEEWDSTYDASTGNYNFKVTFTSAGESKAEPNNAIAQASYLPFNTTVKGQIAINDRDDYFKINVSSSGTVKIEITSYMQYYCLVVYNSSGIEVWDTDYNEWTSTTGKRSDTHQIELSAGTYYIKVNGYKYRTSYASTGTYTLKVKEFVNVPVVTGIYSKPALNSIVIGWGKIANATGYELYRYNASSKKYVKVATTKSTKGKVTKLKAGMTYKFKVRAYAVKNGVTYYGEFSEIHTTGTKTAAPAIKAAKRSNIGQVVVTWKKTKGADGYQVAYSTSKKFKKKATSYTSVYNTNSKSKKIYINYLKSNKKYYFKVRAYRIINGQYVYSTYSKVKAVKTK